MWLARVMPIVHSSQNLILKYCTKSLLIPGAAPATQPFSQHVDSTVQHELPKARPLTLRQVRQHREPGFMDLHTPAL